MRWVHQAVRAALVFGLALAGLSTGGQAATAEPVGTQVAPMSLLGGDRLTTASGVTCTAGFMATNGSAPFVITAGHCTEGFPTWSRNQIPVGPTALSSFPGNDYGAIRVTNLVDWAPGGGIRLPDGGFAPIDSAGSAPIGSVVCVTSEIGGLRCGSVLRTNATVDLGGALVSGLIEVALCTLPGESGAPVFSDSRAIGVVVGSVGGCTGTGRTFVQPIGEALSAAGLTLL